MYKKIEAFSYIEVLMALFLAMLLMSIIIAEGIRLQRAALFSQQIAFVTKQLENLQAILLEAGYQRDIDFQKWLQENQTHLLLSKGGEDLRENQRWVYLSWKIRGTSIWRCPMDRAKNRSCLSWVI